MGYLSQKKKNIRKNILLRTMVVFLSLISLGALLFDAGWLKGAVFHIYLFSFIIWLYSLFVAKFGLSFLFLVIVVINYFHVASSSPIFFNQKVVAEKKLSVVFSSKKNLKVDDEEMVVLKKGHLLLYNNNFASFTTIDKQGTVFSLLSVYIDKSDSDNTGKAFKALSNFILSHDEPMIIVGDFGVSPWEVEMKRFLNKTDLTVKNRLTFSSPCGLLKFWEKPSFFVLGFKNIGVEDVEILESETSDDYPEIRIDIKLN